MRRGNPGWATASGPIRPGRVAGLETRDLFLELVDELLERAFGQSSRMGIHDRLGVQLLESTFPQLELSSRGLELSSDLNINMIVSNRHLGVE
jgi:hypothetical protein